MFEHHSLFVITLAGIAFFMLGMQMASHNLRKLTANRTRDLIQALSKKQYLGVLLGTLLTVMLQSSGAVTSMLVGLGSAGVIQLRQVMAVILGTAIGSTFTVQLISLDIVRYGLVVFMLAFFIHFLTNRRSLEKSMAVVMGFGLIFWGLEVIGYGTNSLKDVKIFFEFLEELNANPFLAIVLSAFITAVVHSSAVTIGFAMTLAASGQIDMANAIYWVFGANIGTTATALMASMGGNYVGKQVAWAHCLYKVLGVLIFMPFVDLMVPYFSAGPIERNIANFHTVYNVLAALIFYPGVHWGALVVEKVFTPSKSERTFGPKFLTQNTWQSPSVAIAHAEREALRMADIVKKMLKDSLALFRDADASLAKEVRVRDDKVDLLNREIRVFLTEQLDWSGVDYREDQGDVMRVLTFTSDMESVADVIDNNLREMASKKHGLKLEFSEEGWNELVEIHTMVMELHSLSVSCFLKRDQEIAGQAIFRKREIRKLENRLRERHIARLIEGKPKSLNTSSIHMDVLGDFRRISGLLTNHVYQEFARSDQYNILPRTTDD